MNISIVIPDSNDLKIENCINSIDEKVEVVISLNSPSKKLTDLVEKIILEKKKGRFKNITFSVCKVKEKSIALAYNNGIDNAKHDNILLMDSDCVFEKKTIIKLFKNLGDNMLSKGKVRFKYSNQRSKIIAKARDYTISNTVNAYSPPLLFKKKIIQYIGKRYYFHPKLCWLEDSEFDKRVKKANLKISYDSSAIVIHDVLSFTRDLRSAFWYGVGKSIGVKEKVHDKPTGFFGSIKKYLVYISRKKGISVGIYLFIWKLAFLLGYNVQRILKIR